MLTFSALHVGQTRKKPEQAANDENRWVRVAGIALTLIGLVAFFLHSAILAFVIIAVGIGFALAPRHPGR